MGNTRPLFKSYFVIHRQSSGGGGGSSLLETTVSMCRKGTDTDTVFLASFYQSVSPCYIRFGQLTWPGVSSASLSQRAWPLKNTPFHLRFLDAFLALYRLPGIQFVPLKCPVPSLISRGQYGTLRR